VTISLPRELRERHARGMWPAGLDGTGQRQMKTRSERLHKAVCAGEITLAADQESMRRWGQSKGITAIALRAERLDIEPGIEGRKEERKELASSRGRIVYHAPEGTGHRVARVYHRLRPLHPQAMRNICRRPDQTVRRAPSCTD